MAGIPRLFIYKCSDGHETKKEFPPNTNFDDHEMIICPECAKPAYIVFACSVPGKTRA